MAFEWIGLYLAEADRIETFFLIKLEDLINEFIQLQENFRVRADIYEEKDKKKEGKKDKKEKKDKKDKGDLGSPSP